MARELVQTVPRPPSPVSRPPPIPYFQRQNHHRSTMKKWILCLFAFASCPLLLFGQVSRSDIASAARAELRSSLEQFHAFLSLPNDAHIAEDLEPNMQWLSAELEALNFAVRRLPTKGLDLMLAERQVANPVRTLLIYLQVDGQPVDPTKWYQDHPFTPALKKKTVDGAWEEIPWQSLDDQIDLEWRVFARSTADSKGAITAFLAALRIAQAKGWTSNYNIKIIMDSEEELGSPNLPAAVEVHRKALAADMLIILDGPRHISNEPTLTFGARGITTLRLTTYGPRVPQHSGHYGNYAPNPALRLAQLLASMKDRGGRVTIPGFYDGIVIDDATREILRQVPDDEEKRSNAVWALLNQTMWPPIIRRPSNIHR